MASVTPENREVLVFSFIFLQWRWKSWLFLVFRAITDSGNKAGGTQISPQPEWDKTPRRNWSNAGGIGGCEETPAKEDRWIWTGLDINRGGLWRSSANSTTGSEPQENRRLHDQQSLLYVCWSRRPSNKWIFKWNWKLKIVLHFCLSAPLIIVTDHNKWLITLKPTGSTKHPGGC